MAIANDGESSEIRDLRDALKQSEKTIREKDREIKKLADRNKMIEAKCLQMEDRCKSLQITLNTLYSSYYDGEKEEMRRSRIS